MDSDRPSEAIRSVSTGYAAEVPFLIQMVDDDLLRVYHR